MCKEGRPPTKQDRSPDLSTAFNIQPRRSLLLGADRRNTHGERWLPAQPLGATRCSRGGPTFGLAVPLIEDLASPHSLSSARRLHPRWCGASTWGWEEHSALDPATTVIRGIPQRRRSGLLLQTNTGQSNTYGYILHYNVFGVFILFGIFLSFLCLTLAL